MTILPAAIACRDESMVMGEFHRDNDEIDIGPGDHRGRIGVSRDTIGLAGGFRRRLA